MQPRTDNGTDVKVTSIMCPNCASDPVVPMEIDTIGSEVECVTDILFLDETLVTGLPGD